MLVGEIGDERLAAGWKFTHSMQADEIKHLQTAGVASQYYVRKALEERFGAEVAAYTTNMLALENKNINNNLDKTALKSDNNEYLQIP